MENSNGGPKPVLSSCVLVHELLNRLSVIMGNCDLVIEKTPAGSERAKLLSVIQENARIMALELSSRQCELLGTAQTGKERVLTDSCSYCSDCHE